jgi:hypothetical protein
VHPTQQGRGIGGFILEQLEHLARVRGCTHLVLEVAENNKGALQFYRRRQFQKLDAAIFMAKRVASDDELLPPRPAQARAAQPPEGAEGCPHRATRRDEEAPARVSPPATRGSAAPCRPRPRPTPHPRCGPQTARRVRCVGDMTGLHAAPSQCTMVPPSPTAQKLSGALPQTP